jgi:nitrite reductase/ring-hydroxylating ferredoxin subunit/uncharacterized membrane protein
MTSVAPRDAASELVAAVERFDSLDGVTDRVQAAVREATGFEPHVKDVLSGSGFGHPVHPPLTDVVIGTWTSALLLDLLGGTRSQPGADLLLTAGIVSAVPTAAAGLSDWAELRGGTRRLGAVHALGNTTALTLQCLSWRARRRGHRGRGVALSSLAYGIASVSAWLGGHLSLARAVGVNQTALERLPSEWTPVIGDDELPEGKLVGTEAGGAGVLLVRRNGRIHAIADRCSHRGCSLHEGELRGDEIVCPCHGSTFGLDGSLVKGPAAYPQPALETRTVDGKVEVRMPSPEA